MRPTLYRSTLFCLLVGFGLTSFDTVVAFEPPLSNRAIDFNRDIRPILSENCFYCHGQDGNKREGGVRLDHRDEAISSGAILPDNPSQSGLLQRIHSDDPDLLMPPATSNRRLSSEQKEKLRAWIDQGAPYSDHWAFSKPTRPTEPSVHHSNWPKNAIDTFLLHRMEKEGLAPSPEADRATLIKRLYADLIGLPPTPEEVRSFAANDDPMAYEKLADRLMQSEHYGERMSLPWLDASRYADSNGFQQDGDTWQWMWRDWVVSTLNQNLPFDQFATWQLAGDLLPNATLEQKIASGFNRNHLLNGEGGAIAEEQRFVILFDRMDTTSTVFLGLTMACAQCHDHKYDPITQKDYYRLMDAFNRVPETGTPQFFSKRIRVGRPFIEVPNEEVTAHLATVDAQLAELDQKLRPLLDAAFQGWKTGILTDQRPTESKGLPESVLKLLAKEANQRSDDEKKNLDTEFRKHFDAKVKDSLADKLPWLSDANRLRKERSDYVADQMPRPMVMSDDQPRDTHVLLRGEYLKPDEKVTFNTPAFLPPLPEDAPKNRLGFARWLFSEKQPLTARVQVNRMWQHFFGVGLVKTSEDFGVQSEYPLHLDLLDWLAVEFRESGWDMKRLNRLIVTSAAYRQSSRFSPVLLSYDPENRFYARANRFRMPSMILRDWALASSGLLDRKIGGRPVYPYQPDGIWESLAITKERDFTYPISSGSELVRRSLYTFWRRTVGPANMFDASNRQTCKVRVATTSTPLHALTTLNDPTWVEASRALATWCMHQSSDRSSRLRSAFERILCREPSDNELARLEKALTKQESFFATSDADAKSFLGVGAYPADEKLDSQALASLSVVCLALFNLDEALTRE
ncbi:Planctomycete cytochrome C [Pirellula sp. SH-Sr6A]|uniref:PSD1 and planctomycete cytochrome C domain-containing protein n=1 Tax=Pirellula sp. SH-Sr6A TaxID=1632865 RepID=UPI00078CAEDE|nr:PSD1 and planctomycete cytochrome C domain-containing protein [Pirellula sp. SH-Sr6A]AMV32243.1 Planctomycete cytochrome C [Pirellula sp. SH-Sr6A]